jgi:predicted RNA binding protein YcfA (HicA-like mRNA interferase family)
MNKNTTGLVCLLEKQGFDVTRNRKNHYVVRTEVGEFVTVLASTPSEYRGWQNSISALRRAGFVDPKRKRR